MAQPTADQLAAELDELKAVNAELVRALEEERAPARGGRGDREVPRRTRTGGWGRTLLSASLIVIGALLAPVAVVSTWAHHQLTDTDYFVSTFAPLAHEPAVQDLVADEAVTAIESHIDIDRIADDLFAGLGDLDLTPRARGALQLLQAPVVSGLKDLIRKTIDGFVRSDAFAAIWKDALEVTHRQLLSTATGQQGAAITIGQNQRIQLELGPIIDAVKEELVKDGVPLADRIPAISRSIVLAEDTSIGIYLTIYQIVIAIGIWLPWAMLIMLAAGVLVARRRALALAGASGAVLLLILLAGNGISIGTNLFALAVAASIPHDAAVVLYTGVLQYVTDMLIALGSVAAATLAITLVAGPWPWARRLRGHGLAAIAAVRHRAEQRGITTGTVGERLYRWRGPLRLVIGTACAAFILLVRPITPGIALWTAVLGVGAVIVLELLSRPTARAAAIDTTAERPEAMETRL
ncbi:hypothetical protein [Microbacterium sp. NPDC056052]|uniref:hypothetical protein n=1 Tax=Microbacterium sp. NPDC056052 TaxID=3345695 RepID=UPI0035D62B55